MDCIAVQDVANKKKFFYKVELTSEPTISPQNQNKITYNGFRCGSLNIMLMYFIDISCLREQGS